ncbi:hypothetical protein P4H71_12910 [Paenibacillus kribbensis]|uniref:hypothetical protein n=1 Tax=Paenibacillus kribbensis TaxID=172713 RepID=UPI002DBBB0F5|nr:hypothetical protein [Paenibacillus kribbensis]MEC0235224.1 hypothetical protein [Paenibacillus kribbensis]
MIHAGFGLKKQFSLAKKNIYLTCSTKITSLQGYFIVTSTSKIYNNNRTNARMVYLLLPALFYILFGTFDALAMLVLILKLYRMPLLKYKYRILLFVVCISLFSYVVRVVLQIPKLDLPLQYVFFFLFLRFGLRLKLHSGAFISGTGISAYISIQLILFYLLNLAINIDRNVLNENTGGSVYVIQIVSILSAYLIAGLLKIYNGGFSFISEPPHDFMLQENYGTKTNKVLLSGSILSFITIILMVVMLYAMNPLMCIFLSLLTFGISYFLSDRGDYEDVREAVELYRYGNKKR